MTKYREILRLRSLGLSQNDIASSCHVSKKTVNRVLKLAQEHNLRWPLEESLTDREIDKIIHPDGNTAKKTTDRKMPDFEHVKNELLRNGVNKKLLWAEYLEECRFQGAKPLMYSQFCHYILQDDRVRRATMHINRKPGEQIEVDWAGDPAYIIDSETGEQKKACLSNTTKSPSKRKRAAEKDCSTWKRERSSCIGKKVDVRETDSIVEIFDNGNRIASHARLLGCKGKYSTSAIHMPEKHQKFLEWDGDRFRSWARKIGYSTLTVIERILDSKPIEQQAYKGCIAILSLEKDYSGSALEMACERILAYGITPTYKNILNLLMSTQEQCTESPDKACRSRTEVRKCQRNQLHVGKEA